MNIADRLSTYISTGIYGHIQDVSRAAIERHQNVALVGGGVRDVLLKRSVLDADVMLEHPAKAVVDLWLKNKVANVTYHERFMTFSVSFGSGQKIDIVTAREETYSAPAQLPSVKPSTMMKDMRRRDFTVNAIGCWLTSDKRGELIDPYLGTEDLDAKLIRALHEKSFQDDPTRIYRAARFAGRLGFQVEPKTAGWVREAISLKMPALLSPVRRRHEFELILKEQDPAPALDLLRRWDALTFLHPEWPGKLDQILPHISKRPDKMDLLTYRLKIWFQLWGEERAMQMMTDLAFEKETKRTIQALL